MAHLHTRHPLTLVGSTHGQKDDLVFPFLSVAPGPYEDEVIDDGTDRTGLRDHEESRH